MATSTRLDAASWRADALLQGELSSTLSPAQDRPARDATATTAANTSTDGTTTTSNHRNRTISISMANETPPAKKHRASDDEYDSSGSVTSSGGAQKPGVAVLSTPPVPQSVTTDFSVNRPTNTTPMPVSVVIPPQMSTNLSTDEIVRTDPEVSRIAMNAGEVEEPSSTNPTARERSPSSASAASASSEASQESSSGSQSMEDATVTLEGVESDGEGGVSEDSFVAWLVQQRQQGISAAQLLDVLGLGVSEGVAIDDDELWEAMLSMGSRLLQPSIPAREKLENVNTLNDVVELLQKAQKIVVLAGAGISVSCGIPDFRSENGIYSRLGEYNLPDPQCMFDIDFFQTNPRPFFAFAKELFPKSHGFTFVPSRSHYFLKLLEEKGKLLRIYSQNIDMLEHAAGISHEHSVLCHGSFATATCVACGKQYPGDFIRDDVMKQCVPMCSSCGSPEGIIKPDIVFFGEPLPARFHDLIKVDENEADLVLVMGSSLKVNPVRSIVGRIHKDAPMILINREPVGRPHKFDVELLGYSDQIVEELCRLLHWEIPKPDPALLVQSMNSGSSKQTAAQVGNEPPLFEFIPPSRYLFDGAKTTCESSSDEEDDSEESETSPGHDGCLEQDVNASIDDIDASSRLRIEDDDEVDQDHLLGSGSEMLRTGSFEDSMMSTDEGET